MSEWVVGRAGMLYRHLARGPFIASHIKIADDGPVPDWVHWHRVRFQMIYCYRGSVLLVYEDQGPPFLLEPGDCVLQPPGIRHRVLESTGLEVVEVTLPDEHETHADETLALPTSTLRPDRTWEGQRFVRHRAAMARWTSHDGFTARDTGIADATGGLASVNVVRGTPPSTHDATRFYFVLAGSLGPHAREDAFVVPAGRSHALVDASNDVELLEVTLPTR